jgi:hypothetical protein
LTGEGAGRVLNRDIVNVRGADARVGVRKATSTVSVSQETVEPREVEDPVHARKHLTREASPPDRKPGGLTLGHTWRS